MKCKDCDTAIDEPVDSVDRIPCPNCGSIKRIHESTAKIELPGIKSQLRGKVRKANQNKVSTEFLFGDDLFHKTGQYNQKVRIVDRDRDQYVEIITDPKSGEVVHRCVEPLSEHRGHGSAKKKES